MDMFENPTMDMGYSGETKGMMRDHVDPKPATYIIPPVKQPAKTFKASDLLDAFNIFGTKKEKPAAPDITEEEATNIFNAVGKSISGNDSEVSTMALLSSNEEAPNEATTHNITAKRNITTGEYSYDINTPQTVNSINNDKMMLYFGAAIAVILITQM